MILRHLSFIFALLAALWLVVLLSSSSSTTMPHHHHQQLWAAEAAPAPFNCNSPDKNLIITQDDTTDISNQIEILALDQCNVIINDVTVGSIEFQNTITDSNITIRNVTCTSESSPFCIKFSSTVNSPLSTRQYDFISISDVTFGVGSSFTSSTTLVHFAQTLTIRKATVSNIHFQDFSATVPSGDLLVYGVHFVGLVTCPSLSVKSIFINNAFLRIVASTFTNLISIAFDSEVNSGVLSSSSSSSEPTSSLFMSNVSILNCRFSIETTDSNRLVSGVRLSAITIGFQLVEISNILLHDIYGGLLLGNGTLEFTNLRVDTTLSAVPSSESSSSSALATSLTIYNISAQSLRGQAGSGYAVAHSLRFGLFIEYFSVIRISHIFTSNVTFTGSRSTSVGVTQIFHGQPNSFQSASSTTSIHYSDIAVHGRIHLESASGPLSVIPFALRNIANYSSVTIENIFVADEGIVMIGDSSSKIIIGVQVVSEESSVNSSGGPSSSFLIRNISVPSTASTSSPHASYAETTDNLFNNVNDFYNVTISQLSYLGEWTVPSNLASSGPVVFSILDSNATSILFNTAISNSNITVSGVTCKLDPRNCIEFKGALTNLGTLSVSHVHVLSTAVSNVVVFNASINTINDTLTVDHVSLSIAHQQGSTTILSYAVAFDFSFTTTNVDRLILTNVAIVSSNVVASAGSVYLCALALQESSAIKIIVISNISILDTKVTASDDFRLYGVETESGVSISALSPSSEATSLTVANVMIMNCSFIKPGTTGAGDRLVRAVFFQSDITGFERVKLIDVSLRDIDGGANTGYLGLYNLFIETPKISAPSAPYSEDSLLTISNISAINLRGQVGASYSSMYSIVFGGPPVENFNNIRISHVVTSNITLNALGSVQAAVLQVYQLAANSHMSGSPTSSLYISDFSLSGPVNLASEAGLLKVIALSFKDIANYISVTIENIDVADENVVLTGAGTKSVTGAQVESGSSITSSGGPSSSFLIRNITVLSTASTSSPHTAYAKTTDNLFSNVNDFYNVTISQLSYLGEWTVPSNLVSSGPVVFSILDSNATSILFNDAITDSNITISGVTCKLNPTYCIKFSDTIYSTSSTNDFISISDVTFGVGSSFTSSVSLLHFARTLTIPTATFSHLHLHDFTATMPSGTLDVFGMNFEEVVTCSSLSIKDIFINNATVSVAEITLVRTIRFSSELIAGSVSANTDSKLSITNISSSNITYYKTAAGANNRYLRLIDFRATPNSATDFSSVEIKNISINGVDFGTTSTGLIQHASIYANGRISAPVGSSLSNISISHLSTRNIFGETPSGSSSASSHSFRGTSSPALRYFARVEISHVTASNITLRQLGSGVTSMWPLYFVSANSYASASTSTSLHIHHVAIYGNIIVESTTSARAFAMNLRDIVNYASVTIENIYISDEDVSLVGTGSKLLVGIKVESGSSITSSGGPSSSFLIRNITVPSPASTTSSHASYATANANLFGNVNDFYNVTISQLSYLGEWTVPSNLVSSGPVVFSILDSNATSILFNSAISESSNLTISGVTSLCSSSTANCSLINFGANTLADGTWNITSNNITSSSAHLISVESPVIFSRTLTMNLRDNYIDITSDILSHTPPSVSLNSSTWNLICNRWARPVYSRFAALVGADSSNPTLKLKTCLLTRTTTKSQSLPPTRTVTPPPTQTALRSSSKSTSITTTLSLSSTPSALTPSLPDSSTKTSELTPSTSITHETLSLSNSKSDVLITRLLRDAISQSVQNFGMAVTGIKGGSSATNARKIQAVVAMADCGKEDISDDEIPEIEPDSNPLTLRVGSRRFDTYRGSIVGASLFIVLWGILMFTFAFIRTRIEYGCSLKRALRKVGMPGTLSAPGFALLPVAVNSASAMMMRYRSPGFEEDSAVDLTIVVFGFSIGVCVPLGVLAWTIREVKRHEKFVIPEKEDDDDKKDEDELKDPTWKEWFDWLTEPRYKYKTSKFSQGWGPIFDFVTVPVFIFISFVVTIAMEIAEGSTSLCPKGDRTCCYGGVVSMIALCSLDTLLILFYKIPFLVRIDYVVIPVCSVINVAMAALIYEMFQDSSSNNGMLAAGFMSKRIGNQNFDMSDEKNSSGGVVDHTETLVILSQLAFYLALASGLLGLLNELFGAMFEVRAAYWSGQWKKKKEKKIADLLRNIDDLEEELLPVADKKTNPSQAKNTLMLEGTVAAKQTPQPNKNIVGGMNNTNKDSTASHTRREKSFTDEGHGSVEVRNNSLPAGRRRRQQIGEQIGVSRTNNNNNHRSSPRTKSRERPLPASPAVRLTAEALSKLNRKNSRS